MKLRMLTAASDEMTEAARWYEERVEGLGKRFLSEVRATVAYIRSRPEEPAVVSKYSPWRVRSRRVKRFPYAIIYELREKECVVVAVAHSSRRPGYWRSRRDSK